MLRVFFFALWLLNPHVTSYEEIVAQKRLGNLPTVTVPTVTVPTPRWPRQWGEDLAPRFLLPLTFHTGTFDFPKPPIKGLDRMDVIILM